VIHGDSAGGGSIAFQLTAYGGRNENLFVGGISESPFLPTHRTVAECEFQFDRFAANVSCSGTRDPLDCLRSKDTATLQSADIVSPFPGGPSNVEPDWYFLPVVDGTFSPDYLYNMLERGQVTRVPVIVGDDTDEGTGFSPNVSTSEEFLQFIKANYPHLTDANLAAINKSYPLGSIFPHHTPWFTPAEMAYGEAIFICPGIEITKSLAHYTSPSKTWNYRYDVYDEADESAGVGVPHVSEKPAIFGPGNAGSCDGCSYLTYNKPIVPIVMNYWISFIRSLDPNTHKDPAGPEWQPWGTNGGQRLRILLGATEMEPVPDDQLERCALWKSLASVTEQ
jgi:acetylcholinesterase